MKAEINKDGTLLISVENELESYALNNWAKANIDGCHGTISMDNLIIDTSTTNE